MQKWLVALLGITLMTAARGRESFDEFIFGQETARNEAEEPWFTGPILTPSGHVVPDGHQNYEPYVYWTQLTGKYDAHWAPHSAPTFNNILYQMTMQFGVMPSTEFDMAPQFVYNDIKGEHMWRVSDIPITLAFQLLQDTPEKWYPGIKLRFAANVPLGKYDHLKPEKLGTDSGGVGDWLPNVGLVFTRLHHITGHQYLAWRLFLQYVFPTPVDVRGLSFYGGAPSLLGIKGTRGTVHAGNIFLFLYGAEYSLTQNWVLAVDLLYQHNNKRRFSGHSPVGTKPVGPSREQFALAPGIEYNWNANVGLIAGPWFSFAGRNTLKYMSYVIAINIYN